jgi:hypothetical protein
MYRWSDQSFRRVAGIVLLAAGVALFIIGMNATGSMADRWSDFFTGHFTDATVLYIVSGLAAAALGMILFVFGGRSAAA